MADMIVINGDQVHFQPTFALAVVTVAPGIISGTGKSVAGQPICVEGDEKSVKVIGCPYTTPQFPVPGMGTITIDKLAIDQLSTLTKDQGKKIITRGSGYFMAKFEVLTAATNPSAASTDAITSYPGSGKFITINSKVRAK